MIRWQTIVGVGIGFLTGMIILGLVDGGRGHYSPPPGPILSECDGRVRELVIHYEPGARAMVAEVYAQFLGALEREVTVHVVCPTPAAFVELKALAGNARCRLAPIVVNHPMTTWSRDRWVALAPANPGDPVTLWSPRGEAAEEVWPARAGDERVGRDIAAALSPAVKPWRSDFYFDGGDFMADAENVFVVARVLPRNLQHTVQSREELLDKLAAILKRRVILLDNSPDHHAGMFMAVVGQRRVLVGDPRLAQDLLSSLPATSNFLANLPGGPDFSMETQSRFDGVAAQCAASGYQVRRIPVVPARDGRTYLTYCNALLDDQGNRHVVYLPTYRGVETLNAVARATWEQLGYEVRPVDCTDVYRHFGCLHCLVNVLSRSPG